MEININKNFIEKLDISPLIQYITSYEKNNFIQPAGKEHYRLLAYLSTQFNNTHLTDIGTRFGSSAVALSFNNTNIVDSYDISDSISYESRQKNNINFHIKNILENIDEILHSPLILLDIDPHDGIQELDFLSKLNNKAYNGFVLLDDISASYWPNMYSMWQKITNNKLDISTLGHLSGTGLVIFGDARII